MEDSEELRSEDAVIPMLDRGAIFEGATFMVGNSSVLEARPCQPFDEGVIEMLSELSRRLLGDAEARAYPDVVSFAFWCRKSNLSALAESYAFGDMHRLGRGRTLHIAPANVPVNFAFSFAFSHLAGNVDIVRAPSRSFPQVEVICRVLGSLLEERSYSRAAFLRWPSDSTVTEALSTIVDSRVIWGSDATAAAIRKMPCKPRCLDIVFPDRYSVSIMNDAALAELDDEAIADLAVLFFNDTYLMDQNACSSPQVIAWLGNDAAQRGRFWSAVRTAAHAGYDLQGAIAVDKYVHCFEDATDRGVRFEEGFDGYLTVSRLESVPTALNDLRGVGGYFYEFQAEDIPQVVALLDQGCQTITYFGIDPGEVADAVIAQGSLGVDRIVPFGKAMDIGIVWDGFDLVDTLSRCLEIR